MLRQLLLVCLGAFLPLACTAQTEGPAATSAPAPAAATATPPVRTSYTACHVEGPYIAMTYDDGPSLENTPRLLDLLKQRGIKATFFMVGENAAAYPQIVKRIHAEGHEVANHSWSHPQLSRMSDDAVKSQLERTQDAIERGCGVAPKIMRPPYGAFTERQRRWCAGELGLKVILWDVDPLDWKIRNAAHVESEILKHTVAGSIILSHDIHKTTVDAMPATLDELAAKGFKFVTVSQLLAMDRPLPPKPPKPAEPAEDSTSETKPESTTKKSEPKAEPAGAPAAAPAPSGMIADAYLQSRGELGTALGSLITLAQDLRGPSETLDTLQSLQQSLRDPFLFVVVGEVKSGKSSLLNALFGREFCKVDVLPATDKIYVFKYGPEERTVHLSDRLAECYRDAPFLKDFNIVDTPGTNTIVAEHQTITEQFLPLADLVLFVFSSTNPWGASAWEFLKLISKKWLKRVVFVIQQADLRAPEEISAIVKHLEQTMMERIGHACPIFPVSAKQAFLAKSGGAGGGDVKRLLAQSGFDRLEKYINEEVAHGEVRMTKLRSVGQTAQVLLRELGAKVREAMTVVDRDTTRLAEMDHSLVARKEQSVRQLGGVVWTLSQSYDRAQKRGEELLLEKLTLGNTLKLIFGKGDWRYDFQKRMEDQLRDTLQRQIANSLELLEGDLRAVWQQLHDTLRRNFSEQQPPLDSLPDFQEKRDELLRRIELTLLERGTSQQVEQQLGKLFEETANWLRVPAGVAAVGSLATLIAIMAHSAVFDVTGTVAGLAAATGTVIAVVKRKKILAEFARQMTEKRDVTLAGIEDHLRHSIDRFYQELARTFQPLQTFCIAQRKLYEPMLVRIRELEDSLGRQVSALTGVARLPH